MRGGEEEEGGEKEEEEVGEKEMVLVGQIIPTVSPPPLSLSPSLLLLHTHRQLSVREICPWWTDVNTHRPHRAPATNLPTNNLSKSLTTFLLRAPLENNVLVLCWCDYRLLVESKSCAPISVAAGANGALRLGLTRLRRYL